MTRLGLTPQLFKAALGLLGMGLRQFCTESGVSLTRMSEFQNNPDISLSNTTIQKILTFTQNKGVRISEEGVSYIKRLEARTGVAGLRSLYDDIYRELQNGGDLKVYNVASNKLLEVLGAEFLTAHVKRMANIKGALSSKALVQDQDLAIERPYTRYKSLEKDLKPSQSMIIYAGVAVFLRLDKSNIYVQIQRDQNMAEMCENFFDSVWYQAHEVEFSSATPVVLKNTA